jgi:hypothetical protein
MKVFRKTVGTRVYFIISEADAKYHDAIKYLYFEEDNSDFTKSSPLNTPHIDKCYINFKKYIKDCSTKSRCSISPVEKSSSKIP